MSLKQIISQCDFCNKEFTKKSYQSSVYVSGLQTFYPYYDLCNDCKTDFLIAIKSFIESRKDLAPKKPGFLKRIFK